MKTKYITWTNQHDVPDAIIFSWCQQHADIARMMGIDPDQIIGAGFVQFTTNAESENGAEALCFGESTSLKIKSSDEDDSIVKKMIVDPNI